MNIQSWFAIAFIIGALITFVNKLDFSLYKRISITNVAAVVTYWVIIVVDYNPARTGFPLWAILLLDVYPLYISLLIIIGTWLFDRKLRKTK